METRLSMAIMLNLFATCWFSFKYAQTYTFNTNSHFLSIYYIYHIYVYIHICIYIHIYIKTWYYYNIIYVYNSNSHSFSFSRHFIHIDDSVFDAAAISAKNHNILFAFQAHILRQWVSRHFFKIIFRLVVNANCLYIIL